MSQHQRRRLEELQVRVAQLRLQVAQPPEPSRGKVARSEALLKADTRVARLRHELAEAKRAWVQLRPTVVRGMLLPQLPLGIVAAALLTLEECFNQRPFTVTALRGAGIGQKKKTEGNKRTTRRGS